MKAPSRDNGWERVITACFAGYGLYVSWDAKKRLFSGIPTFHIKRFNPRVESNLWARIPDYFNRSEGSESAALCMIVANKQYGDAEDQLVVLRLNTFLALLTEVKNNEESWRKYVQSTTPFNHRRVRSRPGA